MLLRSKTFHSTASVRLLQRLRRRAWILGFALCGLLILVSGHWLSIGAAVLFFIGLLLSTLIATEPEPSSPMSFRSKEANGQFINSSIKFMINALQAPSILIDSQGKIQLFNNSAEQIFAKLTIGESLSLHLRQLELAVVFDEVIDTRKVVELEYARRIPQERWYRVTVSPLQEISRLNDRDKIQHRIDSSDHDINFLLVQFFDLSEQKRIERLRVDFIANASHELRTPLASMSGFIETLQGSARSDPDAQLRFLAIMQEQAQRMSRLIDDLLSLSHIEMKEHVRPTEQVELNHVLSHVLDALVPLAKENNITFVRDFPDQPVTVPGDENDLIQVFNNLIENAIKYGASGKKVDIVLQREPPHDGKRGINSQATVIVRDYGPGIASEHVPRLTERFYRVDTEMSRQKKGTGLGLAIVKHILNRHGARLEIETQLGAGAEFRAHFLKN